MASAGTVISGRYRLERLLGEGGMGQVWVARHLHLDSQVALKILAPSAVSNEVLRARFEREARALAQLRSPHVVQIYDYGLDEANSPFMVMELLEGDDLAYLRSQRRYWTLSEVAQIVVQAARGLSAAHKAGVIHRDVKPGNLFLAQVEGTTILKVLDFGIAKSLEDTATEITKTNVGIGSPSYMSPEQTLTQAVDGRTDVWALGVVAFVLLTGELPFQAESPFLVGQKVLRGQRPRATEIGEGLPRAVDAFFDRALAVSKEERFATPLEMAEALTSIARLYPSATAVDPDAVMTEKVSGVHSARQAALNAGREQAQLGRTVKLAPDQLAPGLARAGYGPRPESHRSGAMAAHGHAQQQAVAPHPAQAPPPPSLPPSSGNPVAPPSAPSSGVPAIYDPFPAYDGAENAPTAKLHAGAIRHALDTGLPEGARPLPYNAGPAPSFQDRSMVSSMVSSAVMPNPFASKRRALMIAAIVGGTVVNLSLFGGLMWVSVSPSHDEPAASSAPKRPAASAPPQVSSTPPSPPDPSPPPPASSPARSSAPPSAHPTKPPGR